MTIVLKSTAPNAEEEIQKVFEKNGLEIEAPETPASKEGDETREVPEERAEGNGQRGSEGRESDGEDARPRSRFQRRLERATATLHTENQELRARLEALEGNRPTAEEAQPEAARPKRGDFQTQEEYEDALLAWGTDQAIAERDARAAEEAEQRRGQEILEGYHAQVEEFKDEHDDWDETVKQNLPVHQPVQLAILEMPNGAEVTYYMGKHPDYTRKLAEMTPLAAVMEIGRLSERLKGGNRSSGPATAWGGEARPAPRKPAPAPVQPVRTGTIAPTTSRDAAKAKDYQAFKRAQRGGR